MTAKKSAKKRKRKFWTSARLKLLAILLPVILKLAMLIATLTYNVEQLKAKQDVPQKKMTYVEGCKLGSQAGNQFLS